uniref:PH domain-containing protein n=1 Tax=Parastrongyloides trichosuri TaxID=131310 RepID=A0A0N4Z909_PARTI
MESPHNMSGGKLNSYIFGKNDMNDTKEYSTNIFDDTSYNVEMDLNKTVDASTDTIDNLKKTVEIYGIRYKESKNLNKKVTLPLWNQLLSNRKDVVTIGKINIKEHGRFLSHFGKTTISRRCCITESGHLLIYSTTQEDKGHLLDLKKMEKIVFEGYSTTTKHNRKLVSIKLKWSFGSVTLTLFEDEISEWKEPIFVIHESCDVYELTKKFHWTHRRKPIFNTTLNEEIDTYYNHSIMIGEHSDSIEYDENEYLKKLELVHPSRAQIDIHEGLEKLITNSSVISQDGSRYDTPRPRH